MTIIRRDFHHPHDTPVSALAVMTVVASLVAGIPGLLWLIKGAPRLSQSMGGRSPQ